MLAIQGLKCIYDTGARGWAMELVLSGAGEDSVRRFDVDGPDDAEMLIEAYEDSSSSSFDPATREIVFSYEYADLGDEEDDSEDDDDSEEDAEDQDDASDNETSEDEDEKAKA